MLRSSWSRCLASVAFGLTVTLGVTAASPLDVLYTRHHRHPVPAQQWGSAGSGHAPGGQANKTLPPSLRGQYPVDSRAVQGKPNNQARIDAAPATAARGFDRATSKEDPGARDAHERTYTNTDGTLTTEYSTEQLNYRKPDGSWAPIDTKLVAADQGWRTAEDSAETWFAAGADSPELTWLAVDAEHVVAYGLAGGAKVDGVVDGSTITYPKAWPGTDVRVEARGAGMVKETLVLHGPDTARSFDFSLRLTGLTAAMSGADVALRDATGQARAIIPAGTMVDAAGSSKAVTYRLTGSTLRVELDDSWLADPARQFPVSVDPTMEIPVASGNADATMNVTGGGSTPNPSELIVGRFNNTGTAAYLKFGGLAAKLRFHTIYGVQLELANTAAATCAPRTMTVHPVTQAWTPGTGFTYPGPSVGPAMASPSFAHGGPSCAPSAELINLGGGGKNLVQGWANGAANNGISLRASDSDASAWKKFLGAGSSLPPALFVTHSPYNAAYEIANPVPDPPVLQNQSGRVQVTVTNLSAEDWQPGTYYLAYRAYNADNGASVTQQRAADLTGTVARNAKATLTATIRALPPGRYFLDFTMVRSGGIVFTDQLVTPIRLVLEVPDVPPVITGIFPPNGYQTPTLTPQLWAGAADIDTPPGSHLSYKFELCERDQNGNPVNCSTTAYQTSPAWTVPSGRLLWGKRYLWRAWVKDTGSETETPRLVLLADVPQPELTAHIANAPNSEQRQEYDPRSGNFTTLATDAPVASVGPELTVVRTYNSLDPRRDSLFGAGWTTVYDMRVRPDDDGTGNVVVTYPDGQEVRYGRNPDGTYAAPSDRMARLTLTASAWQLRDQSGTVYQFSLNGRLSRITDAANRATVLTYSGDGKLTTATAQASGRALRFAWSGNHIGSVTTDAGPWSYTYSGDKLTKVCGPDSACDTYDYTAASYYRGAVTDALPESYWRLGESSGTAAASEVAVNLGKDAGTYHNVQLGTAGPLAGSDNTAGTFSQNSYVDIPNGTLKKSRDLAVELWFKANPLGTGGPLIGYQDKAFPIAATAGVPVLYVGTDGLVHGQFATGTVAPVASTRTVNDGKWHHVVLSAMGGTTTLYLDGTRSASADNQNIDHTTLTYNQIGAAYATSPASWPGWGSAAQRSFSGAIDEVAVYPHPLGPGVVAAHYQWGTGAADQLTKITLPSGKVAAEAQYDGKTGRIKEYTDDNGGAWQIGAPAVYGSDNDLRRSVEVRDPGHRSSLYEYDGLTGLLLRQGTPAGLEVRGEDTPGEPTGPPDEPVPSCPAADPNDPKFCTVIPDSSGGPVFVRHSLEGIAIRTFTYDDRGLPRALINETGDTATMEYDDRGNVTSRKTCRIKTECHTAYFTFPPASADPIDPRSSLVLESRDARSSGSSDNTYLTTYTYTSIGNPSSQRNPDGGVIRHTYTDGTTPAVGGGTAPSGLVTSDTDARNAVTRYSYFASGDLAQTVAPSGLTTNYTYDSLGRKTSETQISDSYPTGLTTQYTYDAMSRLVSTTWSATTDAITGVRHQKRSTTTYDADGNTVKLEEADLLGGDATRVTTTVYDEHNHVQRVVDAEGRETNYGYDLFGNKTSTVDGNGNRTDYAYTARNAIAEVRLRDYTPAAGEPNPGAYLVLNSYSYDYAGRLASSTDAMGRRVEYVYYGDDLLRSKTLIDFHDPGGAKRNYVMEDDVYDGAGHLTKQTTGNGARVTQHTINPAGRVDSTVIDPGRLDRRTVFSYDKGGKVTQTTQSGQASNVPWPVAAVSTVTDTGYDTAGNKISETVSGGGVSRVTRFGYDQRGVLTSTVDPRSFTTDFVNDELGRQTTITKPPVAAENVGGSSQNLRPVTTTGYDTFGDTTAQRDPVGNVTKTGYDRLGKPTTLTGTTYTPPGGQPITPVAQVRYDGVGNRAEIIDARGNATRFGYDRLNRLVTKDVPAATNNDRAVWHYTYTRTGKLLSTSDPVGGVAQATYDDLDRKVTSTQAERAPVADAFTTTTRYDDAGNAVAATSPTGAETKTDYDAVGSAVKITDPSGVPTQQGFDYAGRQVRATDGLGRTGRKDYDPLGRLIGETDLKPDGTAIRAKAYGYDAAGNRTSATTATNVTTIYAYDSAGQLTSQTEPVSASSSITTSYGYDAGGARTRSTDGRGNVTTYTVNSWRLPESVIEPATSAYPSAADRTWTTSYNASGRDVRVSAPGNVVRQREYDAAGRLTKETGTGAEAATATRERHYDLLGRLTGVSTPGGDDTFSYNDRGLLLGSSGPSGSASLGYDDDGKVTTRTDASGTARFGYDHGRLSTMTDALTGTTIGYGYDAAGKLATQNYGSGFVRTTGYDDLGRVSSDVLRNGPGAAVSSLSYGYDLDDHLTTKTVGGVDNAYTYDLAGRLTSWTMGGVKTEYAWDASGNRISAGGKTATFDERNRVQSDGTYSYTYSARGTLATKTTGAQTQSVSFDAFDRLTARDSTHYAYDGLDRLFTRDSAKFSYAGTSDAPMSFGATHYGRDADGDLVATGSDQSKQLSIADKHGDVVGSFNPTDTNLATLASTGGSSRTYDPFGKVTGTPAEVGFQGKWTDPSGDVAMGARWYDSGTGTFESRDDDGYDAGGSVMANRYVYGANAPLDFVDPDGHMTREADGGDGPPVWQGPPGPNNSIPFWFKPFSSPKDRDLGWEAVLGGAHAIALGYWRIRNGFKPQDLIPLKYKQLAQKALKPLIWAADNGLLGLGPMLGVKVTKAIVKYGPAALKVAAGVVKGFVQDTKKFVNDLIDQAKRHTNPLIAGLSHGWQQVWDSSYGQMYKNGWRCLAELDGKACNDMWGNVQQNLGKAEWNPFHLYRNTLKALGDGVGVAAGMVGMIPFVGKTGLILSLAALGFHGMAKLGGAEVDGDQFLEDAAGALLAGTPFLPAKFKRTKDGVDLAAALIWGSYFNGKVRKEIKYNNFPAKMLGVMGWVSPGMWLVIPLANELPDAVAEDLHNFWDKQYGGE